MTSRPEDLESTKNSLSLLQRLVESDGTSGFEENVRKAIIDELKDSCGKITVDAVGNMYAPCMSLDLHAPSIMLASHMDEVGLIVKYIRPDGYLAFELSGLVDPCILPSQWVRIHTANSVVHGVIGAKAAQFAVENRSKQTHRSMWIDVGARSKEEAAQLGVRVGDYVTYDRSLMISENQRYVVGKALDNRIGCTVLIESMRRILDDDYRCNVKGVGTVMEEVGAIGAKVAANAMRTHVAIVLDGIPASDPSVSFEESAVQVGQGPVIEIAELQISSSAVTPKWLMDLAREAAQQEKIPYQIDVTASFFSEASRIMGEGTPAISILVPRLNSHSPAEMASIDDMNNAIRLTSALIGKISSGKRTSEQFGIQ